MMNTLLGRLEALSNSAQTELDRAVYRAQWAGAIARLGHIEIARKEISRLREINSSYSPLVTGWILVAEGLVSHYESLSVAALDKYKRAYGIAIAFGDADLKSFSAAWMSASEFLVGNYEDAAAHAVEAIGNAPPTGSLARSRAHLVVANLSYAIGLYSEAAPQYMRARHFAVEAHDISMQSAVLYNVAAFHIARLSLEDAFGRADQAEVGTAELELNSVTNLDRGIGVDSLSAMIPILRGQLMLVKQEWRESDSSFTEAIPDAVTYGQLRWESRFLAEQAHCRAKLGMHESAKSLVDKAVSQLSDRVELDDLAACHARAALALSALGQEKEADSHYKTGQRFAREFETKQLNHRQNILPLLTEILAQK
jgi:tetratricopeptide (TPR) repeat protein